MIQSFKHFFSLINDVKYFKDYLHKNTSLKFMIVLNNIVLNLKIINIYIVKNNIYSQK